MTPLADRVSLNLSDLKSQLTAGKVPPELRPCFWTDEDPFR